MSLDKVKVLKCPFTVQICRSGSYLPLSDQLQDVNVKTSDSAIFLTPLLRPWYIPDHAGEECTTLWPTLKERSKLLREQTVPKGIRESGKLTCLFYTLQRVFNPWCAGAALLEALTFFFAWFYASKKKLYPSNKALYKKLASDSPLKPSFLEWNNALF